MVIMSDDRKSVRAFETTVDGQNLEFFAKADAKPLTLVDQQSGSEWDFSGRCVNGQFKEHQLKRVDVLVEYFFDWKNYHPESSLYQLKQE